MVVQPGRLKNDLAADSLPDRTDRWADVILTRSNAKRKRLHPELGPLYRCICKTVPFDFITDSRPEYHIRLRIVRFQIAEGGYENIITNLPSDEFSLEQIKHIYHLRWGQLYEPCSYTNFLGRNTYYYYTSTLKNSYKRLRLLSAT